MEREEVHAAGPPEVELVRNLTLTEVEQLVSDGGTWILDAPHLLNPTEPYTWDPLTRRLLTSGPELRVYVIYSSVCDWSFEQPN
jgi:hypothetical protein